MLQRARAVGSTPAPVLIAAVLLLALGGSVVVSQASLALSVAGTLLLIAMFASFLNTELALHGRLSKGNPADAADYDLR